MQNSYNYTIPNSIINIGKNKKYFIRTYGCQMNERDSENISAILEELGYEKEEDYLKADILILNTCAIRENAHNKAFGMLGRFKHLKESRPEIIVGIAGCMPQEKEVIMQIKIKQKWVNFIIGTHNIYELPIMLEKSLNTKKLQVGVWEKEGDTLEKLPIKRESKYKAWVNITYGCDKFCTYCIVPYTRGGQRSRLPKDIIKEVESLILKGYKEVTLLGQNVNSYGDDLKEKNINTAHLLNEISKTKIDRIRFVTSHPWEFTDEMINIIKTKDNIMPYIHLPVQSGSNEILNKMGRKYTREYYIKLYNKIKKEIPDASITTDIIVGFPNETKEDFQSTIDLVNECKFDGAYTFLYSKRKGTPAAKFKDNISLEDKEKRLTDLNLLINKYSLESNKKLVNKIVPVLVESKSIKNLGLVGHTDTMKLVNVKADEKYIGKIINVKITNAKTWSLSGEIVK